MTPPALGSACILHVRLSPGKGGFIRVASEVGSGSTFSVFLPHS